MNLTHSSIEPRQVVEVDWCDRWIVYQRLQELDIPCSCATHKPLQAQVSSPTAMIQLWSVTKQYSSSRQELIDWLKGCWNLNKR